MTYQKLLVPVDGSELSDRAMNESIQLARQLGASIVGFVAEPALSAPAVPHGRQRLMEDARRHHLGTQEHAQQVLGRFAALAQEASVRFTGVHAEVSRVDHAIIEAAEAQGCDLIIMVTHGRGAFGEFLFGSQTKAVLAGCKLPLLVLH
jgi:nucleotide-binding universal stress UspA family protein